MKKISNIIFAIGLFHVCNVSASEWFYTKNVDEFLDSETHVAMVNSFIGDGDLFKQPDNADIIIDSIGDEADNANSLTAMADNGDGGTILRISKLLHKLFLY